MALPAITLSNVPSSFLSLIHILADNNARLVRFPCGRTSDTQIPIFEELLTREDIHGVITYCWDDSALRCV